MKGFSLKVGYKTGRGEELDRKILQRNTTSSLFAGKPISRRDLGLPDDWSRVKKWLNNTVYCFRASQQIIPERIKKCPEIPSLQNYNAPPPKEFWLNFPQNSLPKTPKTCVNVPVLEEKIR
jgi:hypothetical protein